MKTADVTFTRLSDGEVFDFDLAKQSNGQKMWLAVRNTEPPPSIVSHRISMTIKAMPGGDSRAGGASLKTSVQVIEEIDALIDEEQPLVLDGFDEKKYRVFIQRQESAISESFVAEKNREGEYLLTVKCVALYTEESCQQP